MVAGHLMGKQAKGSGAVSGWLGKAVFGLALNKEVREAL
jgi:hypothetical protein